MTKNNSKKRVVKGICHSCNNNKLWLPQTNVKFKCTKCGSTQENLK